MRKYMWPNSCLPSATALITAAQTASQGRFTLEGVENHAARKPFIFLMAPRNSYLEFRLSSDSSGMGQAFGGKLDTRSHLKRLPISSRRT